MRSLSRWLPGLLLVLGVFSWTTEAQAYYPYGYYGGTGYLYRGYHHEHIPYFSLYPPVYYSYPVQRTYGAIPFSYPYGYGDAASAGVSYEPASTTAMPQTLINPYVEQDEEEASSSTETSQADSRKLAQQARERKIQVIYPAAMFETAQSSSDSR